MKRLLFYIFIPVFAIFLMSHNASAYTAKPISVNSLEYYGTYTAQSNAGLASNCSLDSWPYVSQNGCDNALANGSWSSSAAPLPFMTGEVFLNNKAKYSAMTQLRIPFSADEEMEGQHFMFEFDMNITNSNGNALSSNQFNLIYGRTSTCKISLNDFTYKEGVSCSFVTIDDNPIGQILIDMDLSEYSYTSGDSFVISVNGPWGNNDWGDYYENPLIANLSSTDLYFNWSAVWYVPDAGAGAIEDIITDWKDKEEQAAGDISIQSPSNIGDSTNVQTQSLLDTFGSFVTAIASISPSNCNVDFDLGHIDFGEQNLCSVDLPSVFTGVTSIIVIMFTIPFVYHLVNRILGLIREMQT